MRVYLADSFYTDLPNRSQMTPQEFIAKAIELENKLNTNKRRLTFKETGKSVIGEYYISLTSQYDVTYNYNEEKEIMIILHIYHRSYLYKYLTGQLN